MKIKTHVIDLMSLGCTVINDRGERVWETLSFPVKERISSKSFGEGHRGLNRKVKHLPAVKDKRIIDRKKKGHFTDPAVVVGKTVFGALKHIDIYAAKARFRRDSVNTFERFCTTDFTPEFMQVQPCCYSFDVEVDPIAEVMAEKIAGRLPVAPVSSKKVSVRPPSGTLFERYCSIAAKRRGENPAKARKERIERDQYLMGLEVFDHRDRFDSYVDAMSFDDDLMDRWPLEYDRFFCPPQPDADFFVGNTRVLASSLAARGPVSPFVVPF